MLTYIFNTVGVWSSLKHIILWIAVLVAEHWYWPEVNFSRVYLLFCLFEFCFGLTCLFCFPFDHVFVCLVFFQFFSLVFTFNFNITKWFECTYIARHAIFIVCYALLLSSFVCVDFFSKFEVRILLSSRAFLLSFLFCRLDIVETLPTAQLIVSDFIIEIKTLKL